MSDRPNPLWELLDLLATVLVPVMVIGTFAAIGWMLLGPIGAIAGGTVGAVMTATGAGGSADADDPAGRPGLPCPGCGEKNEPSANFCRRCGVELDFPDPGEVAELRETGALRYCSMCGADVDADVDPHACPSCGRTFV